MDKRSGHTLVRFLRRHPLHFIPWFSSSEKHDEPGT